MSLAHVGPSEPLASDPMEDMRASRWWNPMVKWLFMMIVFSRPRSLAVFPAKASGSQVFVVS